MPPAADDRRSTDLQLADLDARLGHASLQLRLRMTPSGLLAVGGLVGTILLSVTALVWAATAVPRLRASQARATAGDAAGSRHKASSASAMQATSTPPSAR